MDAPKTRQRFVVGTMLAGSFGVIVLTAFLVAVPAWKDYKMARALSEQLFDADSSNRLGATEKLAAMGPNAWPAIPRLIELARGEPNHVVEVGASANLPRGYFELRYDYPLRIASVKALGCIGSPARRATPALGEVMTEAALQKEARGQALRNLFKECCIAIERIGFDPNDVVPSLRESLTSTDSEIRRDAAEFLIRTDRAVALSTFLDIRMNFTGGVRRSAITALGQLGSDAHAAVPALQEDLQSGSSFVRLSAAEAIWKITGNPELTVPTLVELLDSPESYFAIELVIEAIGRIGPDAQRALPSLRKWADNHEEPKAKKAADAAIAAIGF